jgi:hypothetical protein
MNFYFLQYPDSGIFFIFDEWQRTDDGGREEGTKETGDKGDGRQSRQGRQGTKEEWKREEKSTWNQHLVGALIV